MQSQAWLPHNIIWMICIAPKQYKINPINKFSQITKGKTSSPLPQPQSWHLGKHNAAVQASSRALPYTLLLGNTFFLTPGFQGEDFSLAICPFNSLHQLRRWGGGSVRPGKINSLAQCGSPNVLPFGSFKFTQADFPLLLLRICPMGGLEACPGPECCHR